MAQAPDMATISEPREPIVPALAPPAASAGTSARLLSLDVFRGATIIFMILVNNSGDGNYKLAPLAHAEWHGLTPTDWVFPFFLFIMGVAMAFSMARRAAQAGGKGPLYVKVAVRSLLILLVGWFIYTLFPMMFNEDLARAITYQHEATEVAQADALAPAVAATAPPVNPHLAEYKKDWAKGMAEFRIMGVLQRIALVYLLAGFLVLTFPRWRQIALAGGLLLVGYWALMAFAPFPMAGTLVQHQARGASFAVAYADGSTIPLDTEARQARVARALGFVRPAGDDAAQTAALQAHLAAQVGVAGELPYIGANPWVRNANFSQYFDNRLTGALVWPIYQTIHAIRRSEEPMPSLAELGGRHLRFKSTNPAWAPFGHDSCGFFGSIPSLVMTLGGFLAGLWLRTGRGMTEKTIGLYLSGFLALAVGSIWTADLGYTLRTTREVQYSIFVPFNKELWTSSYSLYMIGLGLLALATCYWLIDARGRKRFTQPFTVYGTNAILAYAGSVLMLEFMKAIPVGESNLMSVVRTAMRNFFAIVPGLGPWLYALAWPLLIIAVWWGILTILHRRKIFLRL